jgi:hypothetical protein
MKGRAGQAITVAALGALLLLPVVLPTGHFPNVLAVCATLGAAGTFFLALKAGRVWPWDLVPTSSGAGVRRVRATDVAYGGALALLLVTLLPLPLAVTRLTGRERQEQNRVAVKMAREAESLGLAKASPQTIAATRNRAGTLRVAMLAIAGLSAAALAASLSEPVKMGYLRALALLGAGIGAAGFVALRIVPQGDTVWWVFPIPHGLPGPVACFGNRNHFAGFMALLAPAALAVTLHDFVRRRWLAALGGMACFAIVSVALAVTLSRGGLAAYVVGLFVAAVLIAVHRHPFLSLAPLFAGGALLAAILFSPALRERLDALKDPGKEDSVQTRWASWKTAVVVWRHYPVLGAGGNGFRNVYPRHRTTSEGSFMTHPDNEYVQLLADGGVLGLGVAALLLLALWRHMLVPWTRYGAPPALAVASFAGLAVAGANAVVDFPLHIPPYAIALGSMVGLMLDTGRRSPADDGGTETVKNGSAGGPPFSVVVAAVALAASLAVAATGWGRLRHDSPNWMQQASAEERVRSVLWAPTSSYAWYYLGERFAVAERPEAQRFAVRCLRVAVGCDPKNYLFWSQLGTLLAILDDAAGARKAFTRARELRSWAPVPSAWEGSP